MEGQNTVAWQQRCQIRRDSNNGLGTALEEGRVGVGGEWEGSGR